MVAAEQERPDIKTKRDQWLANQDSLPGKRLFFLDETGLDTKMARLRGRAPKGQRVRAYLPHGHWKTSTFVAALNSRGILAPMILDGPMNGDVFLEYTKHFLAVELKPGDLVVMDNLSSHKVAGVKEAIEAVGARLLFLPPYSPDFNPIEQVFAKLKALLRKAATREVEALWEALAKCLDAFSPPECERYIRNSGYCI